MLSAHGFGCDQSMWRYVWPAFAKDHRIVLFDHVGFGGSDHSTWDPNRYASLEGYAEDVLEICRELDLTDVVIVGHSVSAMIGILAAAAEPDRLRPARPHRTVTALHRRSGLRRGLHARGHRWLARLARQQLPRLVERDGSRDHGQRGSPSSVGGADEQLLPDGPGDRGAFRARDVPLGQPGGSGAGRDTQPRAPMRRGRDSAGGGRRVRS